MKQEAKNNDVTNQVDDVEFIRKLNDSHWSAMMGIRRIDRIYARKVSALKAINSPIGRVIRQVRGRFFSRT